MRQRILFTIVLSVMILLTACSGSPASSPQPTAAPTAAGSTQAVTEGNDVKVSIANFEFTPNNLTVHVGTKVTWTNSDSAPHTVTADDGSFSSGTLNKDGTFSFTFSKEGTFAYHCANHPSMLASVTVVP